MSDHTAASIERDIASPAEVESALANLSPADMLRLKRIAQLRSVGLAEAEWKDLLQESFSRALSGMRRWPRHVPFVAFLAQTIRSIANEHWRRARAAAVTLESDLRPAGDYADGSAIDALTVNPLDPEREVAARLTLERVERLFENDLPALAIIRALGEGLSPEEIQRQTGMTQTEYSTAQRRIRRKVAKAISGKEL